jgi:hypothetical protein
MFQKSVFIGKYCKIFYHFPHYHIKILLGDFNVQLERGDIMELTIVHDSLYQESNVITIWAYHFCQLRTKFCPTSCSQG